MDEKEIEVSSEAARFRQVQCPGCSNLVFLDQWVPFLDRSTQCVQEGFG